MKRHQNIIIYSLLLILCFSYSLLHAKTIEDEILSLKFKSDSITDALYKLSNVANVEIMLRGDTGNQLISKSYTNSSIDKILLDIFSGDNIAALFHYSEQKLISISLWILPKAKGNVNFVQQTIVHRRIDNESDTTSIISPKRERMESLYKPNKTNISEFRNTDKKKADKNKISIPYASFKRAQYSSPITEVAVNPAGSVIEENKDDTGLLTDDIPPMPEPVQFGGLEPPPMPPIMSLYNN